MPDILAALTSRQLLFLALSLLLVALALAGGGVIRRIIAWVGERLKPRVPPWLHVLGHGFKAPLGLMIRLGLLAGAVKLLPLTGFAAAEVKPLTHPAFQGALLLLLAWGFWRASPICGLMFRSAQNRLDLESNRTLSRFFENIYRAVVALLAGLSVLDLLGLPVASLLAGAGVIGLAISLAAQSTLSNLIAGVTLVLERPFGIGDYVTVGDVEGTVEDISFRSTRIRTPDNVLITMENASVCQAAIRNNTSRLSRLWSFTLSMTYQTDSQALQAFIAALEEHLRGDAQVVADTVQVILAAFGPSSLDVSVRCYVTTLTLGDFQALKHRLNLDIITLARENRCAFAYPTTTVFMAEGPS